MTPERIAAFKHAVESTWSGKIGKYEVSTRITKGGFFDNHVNFSSETSDNTKNRSFVAIARLATLYTEDNPAEQAYTDAHEAGHLMYRQDRYDRETGEADLGWEGNIMAEHGVPWGANLEELLRQELGIEEWQKMTQSNQKATK